MLRLRTGENIKSPSLELECELCQLWIQLSPDTYRFKLKPGIRWHNISPVNGRVLTAHDIVYSYNRLSNPEFPNSALFSSILEMNVIDEHTLDITLAHPDADFLLSLSDGHSKIVPKDAIEQKGNLKHGPNIGTGPWLWKSTEANLGSVFEKNQDYFEDRLPFLDKLIFNIIGDEQTRFASFKGGLIDILQISSENWKKFKIDQPNAPLLRYKEHGAGIELSINTTQDPFKDIRLRRALFNAIDPLKLNKEILSEEAYMSMGIPVVSHNWLLPQNEITRIFGNKQAARSLLEETKLPLPIQIEITIGDFGDQYISYGKAMAEQLEEVGFEPNIIIKNVQEFAKKVWIDGEYSIFIGAPPPVTMPNSYLLPIFHSQGSANTIGYNNKELDKLIELQSMETDYDIRRQLILDIQRHILNNAFRFMPATKISFWTWAPRVNYFYPNFAAAEYFHWSRIWVTE